jgi:hypothetical protein
MVETICVAALYELSRRGAFHPRRLQDAIVAFGIPTDGPDPTAR